MASFAPFGGTLPAENMPPSMKPHMKVDMRNFADVVDVARHTPSAESGEYGPPWDNTMLPEGLDMFAEIAWRKRQRDAKAKWMATHGGEAKTGAPVPDTPKPTPSNGVPTQKPAATSAPAAPPKPPAAARGEAAHPAPTEYGPPWDNSMLPEGLDMFQEIAWRKRQKDAKAKWIAEHGENAQVAASAPALAPPAPLPKSISPASATVPKQPVPPSIVVTEPEPEPTVSDSASSAPASAAIMTDIPAAIKSATNAMEDNIVQKLAAQLLKQSTGLETNGDTLLGLALKQQAGTASESAGDAQRNSGNSSTGEEQSSRATASSVPSAGEAVVVKFQSDERKDISATDELAKLGKLRDAGALSEKQFEVAKAKLMRRSRTSSSTALVSVGKDPEPEPRKVVWADNVKDVQREKGGRKTGRLKKSRKKRREAAEARTLAEDPVVAELNTERARLEQEAAKAKAARKARRAKEQSVYDIVQSAAQDFGLPQEDSAGFLDWKLKDDDDNLFGEAKPADNAILPTGGRDLRIAQLDHASRNPLMPKLQFDRQSAAKVYTDPKAAGVSDIANWLAANEMSDYVIPFQEHEIDGEALLGLTQQQLFNEIGVDDMQDLAQLWSEIELLREVVAEEESQTYQEDMQAAFAARTSALVVDQTVRGDSTLPMKAMSRDNPLSGSDASMSIIQATAKGIQTVKELHDVVRRVLSKGFAPGSNGKAHSKCVQESLGILREWHSARNNTSGSPARHHEFLLSLCQQHEMSSLAALTIFKDLSDASLPASESAYKAVLQVLINNGRPPAGKEDDVLIATKVLGKMAEEGFDLATTGEYDDVICGLAAHSRVEEALDLADTAVYSGAAPAARSFTAIAWACEKQGDLRTVSEVFKLMQHAGVQAEPDSYEALIRCAIRAGDTRFSFRAWRRMLSEGLTNDKVLDLCADLLESYGKAGTSAGSLLESTFATLEPNFLAADDTTYTAIIRAGAMCGDLGLSARYLMAMMEASFSPSLSLLEEILDASIEPGAADAAVVAFELWQEVRRQQGRRDHPPSEPYESAMQAAIRARDSQLCNDVLSSALENQVQLAADIIDELVVFYAQRDEQSGEQIFEHCRSAGQPTTRPWAELLVEAQQASIPK